MDTTRFKHYTIRHAAGKIFLLDTDISDGVYHKPIVINETGERIISLLQSGRDESKVASVLADEYGIGHDEMLGDVREFISSIENSFVAWN